MTKDEIRTAAEAAAELLVVATRYMRVRLGGGDLRPEYPALKRALQRWAIFHPEQAFAGVEGWRMSLGHDGEVMVLEAAGVAYERKHRRTTKQCYPRQKEREKGVVKS